MLFNHALKREERRHKITAALHGVEIKEDAEQKKVKTVKKQEEIKNMTQEQKQELTDKMMRQHRAYFEDLKRKKG